MSAFSEFWLPPSASADSKRLLLTRALRGFADGAVSVLLPGYLSALGFSSFQIAAIIFATLTGSAALTLWIGFAANRIGRRHVLLAACVLMFATGLGFTLVTAFWPLFVVAFVGTLNPSAGDVSLFLPVEQSALAETVKTRDLTAIFSRYNVAGAFAGALGALASGLPALLTGRFNLDRAATLRLGFVAYSLIAIAAALVYRTLTLAVETAPPAQAAAPLAKARWIVLHLSALFSLDSFGGGFVVQSLLALWLFRRFNMSIAAAGSFFFVAGLLGAASQLASSWFAGRIGRINTMVFTHVPANLFMVIAALMPNLHLTLLFLLLRFGLSSMDVPARQSFVMAVVPPEERAAAASVTNVPRSLATALAPLPSGALLDYSTFGWPLVCAGLLKITYDVLLLAQFRAVRPADEME
ncbi:MAG TPA: MFS transporter [Candidatus Binataceae bacterium]|nr:MFS transporter [Candidatus Binataceae bacterium]